MNRYLFKSIKILRKRKKILATGLLFNFLISSGLIAFPQLKCDGSCNVVEENSCCESNKISCCDIMNEEVEKSSQRCEMEFAENSCDLEYESIDAHSFLLPKSKNFEIEFVQISNLKFSFPQETHNFIIYFNSTISDVSPPIYIINSSFLI